LNFSRFLHQQSSELSTSFSSFSLHPGEKALGIVHLNHSYPSTLFNENDALESLENDS
jgi:hypothetical protein